MAFKLHIYLDNTHTQGLPAALTLKCPTAPRASLDYVELVLLSVPVFAPVTVITLRVGKVPWLAAVSVARLCVLYFSNLLSSRKPDKQTKNGALVPRLGLDAVGRLGDGPELPDIVDLPDPHPLADVVVPGDPDGIRPFAAELLPAREYAPR